MPNETVLTMRGICKQFPGVRALNKVDFTLRKGEIHALMGENGAGKSTLIKVLTGVYEKDAGSIQVDAGGLMVDAETLEHTLKQIGADLAQQCAAAFASYGPGAV